MSGLVKEFVAEFLPDDFAFMETRQRVKVIARDVVYGTVGLFVLDVGWRLMDIFIDFICKHVSWLHWLAD